MKVYVSGTLRSFFGKNARIEIPADNVRKVLNILTDEYPDAKKVLFDEDGKLRSFIRIYAGEEDFTEETKWENTLSPESELLLLPAIAGGRTDRKPDPG